MNFVKISFKKSRMIIILNRQSPQKEINVTIKKKNPLNFVIQFR